MELAVQESVIADQQARRKDQELTCMRIENEHLKTELAKKNPNQSFEKEYMKLRVANIELNGELTRLQNELRELKQQQVTLTQRARKSETSACDIHDQNKAISKHLQHLQHLQLHRPCRHLAAFREPLHPLPCILDKLALG